MERLRLEFTRNIFFFFGLKACFAPFSADTLDPGSHPAWRRKKHANLQIFPGEITHGNQSGSEAADWYRGPAGRVHQPLSSCQLPHLYGPAPTVTAWPAISDIWLGIRTVPVLSVAKESRGASQIAHWPRSARTQAGRCGLTDRRSSVKKLSSFVRLLMFPSLLEEITGHGMPVECSKLTCFAKVKIRHGSRAVRTTICWPLSVIVRVLRGRARLGKGENRSKATYPH